MRAHAGRQCGFALLMVLWSSVILALVAGAITRTARNDVSIARNFLDGTRAELAADSGVYRAVSMLTAGEAALPGPQPVIMTWKFGETEVLTEITDESGRIDINTAPVGLLAALFQAVRVDELDARALADSIVSERPSVGAIGAADAQATSEGEEERGSADGGESVIDDLPLGTGDAPDAAGGVPRFTVVEELLQVRGMSRELYQLLKSAITVYTGASAPRRDRAAPLVLAALDGRLLDDDELARLETGEPAETAAAVPPAAPRVLGFRGQPTVIRIRSRAVTPTGSIFLRIAVVDLARSAGAVTTGTRLWQRGRDH